MSITKIEKIPRDAKVNKLFFSGNSCIQIAWCLRLLLARATIGIANYCSLPSLSFGQALGKLQGKVVTHFEEVGWWRTLMVECVTLF